jgi:hypothetical protein
MQEADGKEDEASDSSVNAVIKVTMADTTSK